ncbi:nuclease A inhibitor family protein [Leptolyngbya sp. FACHB-671]|uniref:nuclease A inhibitor family protein n=1 Tax=Leptolyngbya sp. FACHB-671 TaxID=2692812 RepID=UPI0016871631|nr:nuclease A inhibitor family protein [Leptolyngbya sp. FACHB-671]MBD2068014.1 nuclease A inhibitor family protein [Leptolyngbya sp. FACHB-671]
MTDSIDEPTLLEQLKQLTDGLYWMSESDYPFEVFRWEDKAQAQLDTEAVLRRTGHSTHTPVTVVDLDKFFHRATQEEKWHSDEEREDIRRYRELLEMLKQYFSDIQVYRIGEVKIDVYVVGRSPAGNLVGLSTQVVET